MKRWHKAATGQLKNFEPTALTVLLLVKLKWVGLLKRPTHIRQATRSLRTACASAQSCQGKMLWEAFTESLAKLMK